MISINNISKSFLDTHVLINTSLDIGCGSFVCIMGGSGCGKTTLINVILGFEKADSGNVTGMPQTVSVVFQEDRLCEDFSALSNVKMVINNKKADKQTASNLLISLGLGDSLNKPVKELSGGMKRRVAIARALAVEADFVILDEPFKGLDEETKKTVINYVRRKLKGKTVLMVTHDIKEAIAFGAEIYQMSGFGKIEKI